MWSWLGGVEQVFYSTRRLEQRVDLVTKLPDRPAHLSRSEASQPSYILPLEIEAAVVALSPGLPLLPPLLLKVSVVLPNRLEYLNLTGTCLRPGEAVILTEPHRDETLPDRGGLTLSHHPPRDGLDDGFPGILAEEFLNAAFLRGESRGLTRVTQLTAMPRVVRASRGCQVSPFIAVTDPVSRYPQLVIRSLLASPDRQPEHIQGLRLTPKDLGPELLPDPRKRGSRICPAPRGIPIRIEENASSGVFRLESAGPMFFLRYPRTAPSKAD